jgi:hypothetical protein
LQKLTIYLSGALKYSVPSNFLFSYVLVQSRFILAGFLLTVYFQADYSVITMALSMLLADFRFYSNFSDYIDIVASNDDDDYEEDEDDEDDYY